MFNRFIGYYFKHQKNGRTVALIPGVAADGAFVQAITARRAYRFDFPSAAMGREIRVGACRFSTRGVHVDLPGIRGDIAYSDILPPKTDVMGPFRFFPMECRHSVVSLRHRLSGSLEIENERYDFEGGTGYIEGDSGRSFPRRYVWLQANDFANGCGVMVSVAEIPFCGFRFEGCICVVTLDKKEYRLATYLGAKAAVGPRSVAIRQGGLALEADILSAGEGFHLAAPQSGKMSGLIKENNRARVLYRLSRGGRTLCELLSEYSGFECVGYPLPGEEAPTGR